MEDLEQQALAFNEAGQQAGTPGQGTPSVRQMRDQLARSQQLAQQLQQQLDQQNQQQGQPGGQQPGGSQPGQSGQPGQQDQQQGGGGGRQQLSGAGGNNNQPGGGTTQTDRSGNNSPLGNARSIRQQLTQQDIEDFLNQPELFRQLLQPIVELEEALRAQAELESINQKLYATVDEDVPEEYRALVEQYYRVLSESQGPAETTQ